MKKAQVHLIIHGYVQGVFYRASTRETASRMGLSGWVRNLPDGNVEAVFEGPVDRLHNMIEWCREGPPGARVTRIEEKWSDYTGEYRGFSVRYGY
jgi:acylphosphatase